MQKRLFFKKSIDSNPDYLYTDKLYSHFLEAGLMNRKDYISDSEWKHFMNFSENLETPCVIINLKTIKKNYLKLKENFPYADIYYAIKANPHDDIISMLYEMGSNFDIASRYELDKVLRLGVTPDRLSYGNTSMHPAPRSMSEFWSKTPQAPTGRFPENSAAIPIWPMTCAFRRGIRGLRPAVFRSMWEASSAISASGTTPLLKPSI